MPSHNKKESKEFKEMRRLSLFVDDMILYTREPRDSMKTLLELIQALANLRGTKQ